MVPDDTGIPPSFAKADAQQETWGRVRGAYFGKRVHAAMSAICASCGRRPKRQAAPSASVNRQLKQTTCLHLQESSAPICRRRARLEQPARLGRAAECSSAAAARSASSAAHGRGQSRRVPLTFGGPVVESRRSSGGARAPESSRLGGRTRRAPARARARAATCASSPPRRTRSARPRASRPRCSCPRDRVPSRRAARRCQPREAGCAANGAGRRHGRDLAEEERARGQRKRGRKGERTRLLGPPPLARDTAVALVVISSNAEGASDAVSGPRRRPLGCRPRVYTGAGGCPTARPARPAREPAVKDEQIVTGRI